VVATVPVGSGPVGSAVRRTGAFAYVTKSVVKYRLVINTTTNTVVGTVPVGVGPVAIALRQTGTSPMWRIPLEILSR